MPNEEQTPQHPSAFSVPGGALVDERLSPEDVSMLVQACFASAGSWSCRVGVETLGKRCGLKPADAHRCMASLTERGWLTDLSEKGRPSYVPNYDRTVQSRKRAPKRPKTFTVDEMVDAERDVYSVISAVCAMNGSTDPKDASKAMSNVWERKAAKSLLNSHGLSVVLETVHRHAESKGDKYAVRVRTCRELLDKWDRVNEKFDAPPRTAVI